MSYPVSDKFRAALASGQVHYAVSATVTSGGAPVAGFEGMPVEKAAVTVSRKNAQRATLSLTIDALGAPGLVPSSLGSPLAPNGNEIVFSAGLRYPDTGATELVPVGVFPIQTVTVADTGADLTLDVQAADRSWSISRRALLQPYTVASGQTLDQALHALLSANTSGMPAFTYAIQTTTAQAPPNVYNEGQDPWQAGLDLAAGAGQECFFDRSGNLQSRPIPGPGTVPVSWQAAEATADGPLGITRVLTANQVSNDFVVFSSNTAAKPPVRAEVSDTNTVSATWTGGKFGDIPTFLSSSTIVDTTGAQAAAQAQLNASLGQIDTLTLTVLPNPAIDVDDVITVTRPRAGLNGESWVVDGYTLNVGVGATMQITLRRVTL